EREINTTDPEFYKWTQWIFLQMFKKGLAYQSYEPINWCPSCKTGLANEDLDGGRCERCGTLVEKKPMRQWVLKITDYAERLLEGLEELDWPESIKESQRNWIGRSEGAEITFKVLRSARMDADSNAELRGNGQLSSASSQRNSATLTEVKVFTTRPDTLFGATYLVLSPEHSEITNHKSQITNWNEVEDYIEKAKSRGEVERTAEGGPSTSSGYNKTGVELKGIKAINPANGEEIPVWVADYVLGWYGTGAIMAVPAHDERDFEFAKKFGLPMRQVIRPVFGKEDKRDDAVHRSTINGVVRRKDGKVLMLQWREYDWLTPIIGGIDEGESIEEAAIREVLEETGLHATVARVFDFPIESHFYAEHKKEWRSRLDYPVLLEVCDGTQSEISRKEQAKHEIVWMMPEEVMQRVSFNNNKCVLEALLKNKYAYEGSVYTELDEMVNSGKFDGMESEKAKWEITKFVGGKKTIKYKLRDWVFSRQRYWGEPIPLIHCEKCGAVAVPEDELPVKLPEVERYEPTGTGESPLANISEWVNTKCPKCGGAAKRETNTMPQWAGSSWYYIAYAVGERLKLPLGPELGVEGKVESSKLKTPWLPVDMYVGGAEHATRHLIYARFWHKFLFDIGVVSTDEPFTRLQHVGLIGGADGRKMSKRYGNVISPDDVVATFGADTLRLYEMFMGPFDGNIPWSEEGILGPRRFLERVWRFFQKDSGNAEKGSPSTSLRIEQVLHKTIKKVTEDIEGFRFNTAISAMMICFNEIEKANLQLTTYNLQLFLKLLAPFAPHITEEIWQKRRFTQITTQINAEKNPCASALYSRESAFQSIHLEAWPEYDEKLIEDETFQLVVQVNGKMRATITAEKGISQEEAEKLALANERISKYVKKPFGVAPADARALAGRQGKVIFVKDRLVNFVFDI
ncbi:MAG: class I tRNA ligase family protein, partial [Nanoarchaeota archaeon]|nr:class I tRNA ligase family protein [Nanoarchaeota archaeon]